MTIVGYARVSTLDQDHSTQIERLTAAGTKLFSEKKSGTTQTNRTEL